MYKRFDKYYRIHDNDGSIAYLQFYIGKETYSCGTACHMGWFIRRHEMKQEDLCRMAHPCDVWYMGRKERNKCIGL